MNHFETPIPNINITLIGATFVEVPAASPIHFKPLSLDSNPFLINQLADATNGGLQIDQVSLRQIAREIVKPSEVSQGIVAIANGWDSTRCSVSMMFEISTNGKKYREIYTGYTDGMGIGMNGAVDQNMRIYINSHMRVSESVRMGPNGRQATFSASDSTQVLRPIEVLTHDNVTTTGMYGLRPSDVLVGMNRHIRADSSVSFDQRGNLAASSGNLGLASRRNNNIASNYLSKVLGNYSSAVNETDEQHAHNQSWVTSTAAAGAAETDYTAFCVFNLLKESTTYSHVGSFSLNELIASPCLVDPSGIRGLRIPGGVPSVPENVNGWGDYSIETRLASALSNAIPAVCTKYTRSAYAFNAYGDSNGNHNVQTVGSNPLFESPSDDIFTRTIEDVLTNGVMPEVFGGVIDYYTISVSYTVIGSIEISISVDGNPEVEYSLPNYCDALGSSNVTADSDAIVENGAALRAIIDGTFTNGDAGQATLY